MGNIDFLALQILAIITGFILLFILGNKTEKISKKIVDFIYYRLTKRGLEHGIKFTNDGTPLYHYGRRDNVNIGYKYNPNIYAWLADKEYKWYKKGNKKDSKEKILKYADAVIERHIESNENAIIDLDFAWPPYNITHTWHSALVNGRLLQLLMRAYELSNEDKYLNACNEIIDTFFIDIDKNGVRLVLNENEWWYEEYATNEIEPPLVLNGMISATRCIYDYYKLTNNEKAEELFKKGMNAIKNSLHLYDRNGYSYYDRTGRICSPYYHDFHINLMDYLRNEFKDEIFEEYYKKWNNNLKWNFFIRSLKNPTKRSIAACFANYLIYLFPIEVILMILKIFIFS